MKKLLLTIITLLSLTISNQAFGQTQLEMNQEEQNKYVDSTGVEYKYAPTGMKPTINTPSLVDVTSLGKPAVPSDVEAEQNNYYTILENLRNKKKEITPKPTPAPKPARKKNYLNNKDLTIVLPGNQTRRFTHVTDTVLACYHAWKKNKNMHYSISSNKSHSIRQIANFFSNALQFEIIAL